ncbi:MAG: YraN family protein [Vampirovibrionia bacterium]|jgi:putative endonuclease
MFYKGSKNKREIGFDQETRVIWYLETLNYKILTRNWYNSNRGELDIIAIDPERFNEEYLVFIEVKYRKDSIDYSLNALSKTKQSKLKKLALYYCKKENINPLNINISFDFIALNDEQIEHIKNIFSYSH